MRLSADSGAGTLAFRALMGFMIERVKSGESLIGSPILRNAGDFR